MGLDIHLCRFEDHADAKRREVEFHKRRDGIWAHFQCEGTGFIVGMGDRKVPCDCRGMSSPIQISQRTDDEITQIHDRIAQVAKDLRLGLYGEGYEKIEINSLKYKDHLFKVGYFRSSYNETGINRLLDEIDRGKDLAWIFSVDNQDYEFQPPWLEAKARAEACLTKMRDYFAKTGGARLVFEPSTSLSLAPPSSMEEARKILVFQYDTNREGCYSNRDGEFYFRDPMKVVALIPGRNERGQSGIWVAHRDHLNVKFYLQAMEIIIETCDWVLSKKDSDKYWLHWSG